MQSNLNIQLEEVMSHVSRYMRRQMVGAIKNNDLTMTQLETLIFIKQHGPSHMKDIASHFGISMPSATSMIDKLVTMKLTLRENDIKDRRNVTIVLTTKGEQLLQEGWKKKKERLNAMLNLLSEEDKQTLLKIFSTLVDRIKIYEK